MSITVSNKPDEEEWRRFVAEHPAGNIFQTPEMLQVFARAKNNRPECWVASEGGRLFALLLPVQITVMKRLRFLTTRAVAYGSVLCAPGADGQRALAALLQAYTHQVNKAVLFTELRNISSLEAVQPILQEYGFRYEGHLNYLVDLRRSAEAIFQGIGSRTRKNIRRALRRDEVVIEEAKEPEQVAACYDLLRQTYRAARVPLADRSLFEAAFELLYPKGMVRFTMARVGENLAATSVDLFYNGVAYGWYGGTDRAYAAYVPNELLTWHILQWSAEHGCHVYDFGGAGKPEQDYGVRDFKAKFGGELVNYGRNVFVHAPLRMGVSEVGYQFARKFLFGGRSAA
jgi:serine/alanine adding enzyme